MRWHTTPPRWSTAEEVAHSVSHGVGFVFAIAGCVILVTASALRGDAWHVTSSAVFGATLVIAYAASTLYHAIPAPGARRVLRALDHATIYLLIAGTYTPFVLGPLRGPWGWTLFGIVWTAAVAGVVYKSLATGRAPILSTTLYVTMGWCIVIAVGPLVRSIALGGLALIAAGGLCYTFGILFYAWKGLRYHHFIWHLFVLAGSVLHWLAVLLFVIPRG